MPGRLERDLQSQFCKHLKTLNIPFHVDAGDSKKRSFAEQNMLKKHQYKPGFPDCSIFKKSNIYAGLFLELKNGYDKLFYKDGRWKTGTNDYHILQHEFHLDLIREGYYACFAWDLDEAMRVTQAYLSNQILQPQQPIWGREDQWSKADKVAEEFFNKYGG